MKAGQPLEQVYYTPRAQRSTAPPGPGGRCGLFQGQDTFYTTQEATDVLWLEVRCDSRLGNHISPVSVASWGVAGTSLYTADSTGTLDEP